MVLPRLFIFTIGCADILGAGGLAISMKPCTVSTARGPIGKIFTTNRSTGDNELLKVYGCVGSLFGTINSNDLPKEFPDTLKSKSDSHDGNLDEVVKKAIYSESTSSHSRSSCGLVKSTYEGKELKPRQTLTAVFGVRNEDKGWFMWAQAISDRKMEKSKPSSKTLSYVLASMKKNGGGTWEIDIGQKVGDDNGTGSSSEPTTQKSKSSKVGTLGNKIDTIEFWDRQVRSNTKFFWDSDSMFTSGTSIGNYFEYDEQQSILHDIWVVQAEDKSEKSLKYSERQGKSFIGKVVNMFENMEWWRDIRSNAEILAEEYYSRFFEETNDRAGYRKVMEERNKYFQDRLPVPTILSLSKTIDGGYKQWKLKKNTDCNCKGSYVLN